MTRALHVSAYDMGLKRMNTEDHIELVIRGRKGGWRGAIDLSIDDARKLRDDLMDAIYTLEVMR